MPEFSFSEKEWDKVRPASVKKTGVSEALRNVLKLVPKDLKQLKDSEACDEALTAVAEMLKAIKKADGMIKPKDDKNDALGKLGKWEDELGDAQRMVEMHRHKLLLSDAEHESQELFDRLDAEVDAALEGAMKLAVAVAKQVKAGAKVDSSALATQVQRYRRVQSDALLKTSKRGFQKAIRQIDAVKEGVDPKDIRLPEVVQQIKKKSGQLDEAINVLGEVLTKVVGKQSNVEGDDKISLAARKLIDRYKASVKQLKEYASGVKKLEKLAHDLADEIKAADGLDTASVQGLLERLTEVHESDNELEEDILALGFSLRDSQGEIQSQYEALTSDPQWTVELNNVMRDWRAVSFDVFRTCTTPQEAVQDQIDRAVEHFKDKNGAFDRLGSQLEDRIKRERSAVKNRYGATE